MFLDILIKKIQSFNIIFVQSILLRIASLVIGIVQIRLLIDIWGSESYTLFIVLSSTIAWYGLFDFGSATKLRNEISQALLTDELKLQNYTITESFLNAISKIILIGVVVLPIQYFLFSYNKITHSIGLSMNSLNFGFVFLSFSLQFLTNYFTSIFYGLNKFLWPSIVAIVSNFIYIFILLLFRQFNLDFTLGLFFLLNFIFMGLFPLIISCTFFFKNYPSLFFKLGPVRKSLFSYRIFTNINKTFFFQNAESLLLNQLTPLIIVLLINKESVLTYNLTNRLFVIPTVFFAVVNNIYWSIWADLNFRKDTNGILRNFRNLSFLLFGYLFFCFVFIKFNKLIVFHIFNVFDSNLNSYITILFSLLYFIYIWNNIFEVFFNAIQKNKFLKYSSALNIFLFITFNLYGKISNLHEFLFALIISSSPTFLLTLYLILNYFKNETLRPSKNEI